MLAISDVVRFVRFLRLAAARIGGILNLSGLARDAGIAVSTAAAWMDVLVASFQVLLVQPYFPNIGKRQIKAPKLYFLDTGLACHLSGWRTAEVAMNGAMAGSLFENYVVTEIVKSWWHRGTSAPVYCWRTKDGNEVDVLIEQDGRVHPVEIKLTASPGRGDTAGIEALRRQAGPDALGAAAVVCTCDRVMPLAGDVVAVPVGAIA
jgi:predicted AAA+ superfamily ATPase